MSKLKGRTIIELIDSNTGEVETVAENNMIGPAINWLMNSPKLLPHGNQLHKHIMPMYSDVFGGVYLFDGAVPETQIMFPSQLNVIGAGAFQYSNIYSKEIGSYNISESEVRDGYVKHVWDFSTAQANGTIASICLGNATFIKNAYFGCDYTKYTDTSNIGFTAPNESKSNKYDWIAPWGYGISECTITNNDMVPSFVGFPCFCNIIANTFTNNFTGIFFTNDLKEQWTIQLVNGFEFKLCRWNIESYSIKLNGFGEIPYYYQTSGTGPNKLALGATPKLIEERTITVVGSGTSIYYNCWYDTAQQKFYLIANGSSSDLANNGTVSVNVIDFSSSTTLAGATLSNFTFTNKTGGPLKVFGYRSGGETIADNYTTANKWAVVNGYFYFAGDNKVYKIKASDNTDITTISNPDLTGWAYSSERIYSFVYDDNGMLYTGAESLGNYVVINTKKNTIRVARNNTKAVASKTLGSPHVKVGIIPTKTYSLLYCGCSQYTSGSTKTAQPPVPMIRNSYLSTINNLASAVVKTNDKSMKITYILEQL